MLVARELLILAAHRELPREPALLKQLNLLSFGWPCQGEN